MTLREFLLLGEEHYISPDDAQQLNRDLSRASLEDIPEGQKHVVLDYLKSALNMESVDARILCELESLRISIEDAATS